MQLTIFTIIMVIDGYSYLAQPVAKRKKMLVQGSTEKAHDIIENE